MYSPEPFPSLFRLTWQDSFINDLGYLNLPVAFLAMLPPVDMGWHAVRFGRQFVDGFRDTQEYIFQPFQPSGPIQPRFTSWLTLARTYIVMSTDLMDDLVLTPKQMDAVDDGRKDVLIQTDNVIGKQRAFVENPSMFCFETTLYLGERFATQNSLSSGSPMIGYDLTVPAMKKVFQLRGNLRLWEYLGSIRYNLTTDNFMIFFKGGYGLSWYRLEDVSINGELLPHPNGPWINKPTLGDPLTLIPNSWHFGGGIEWMLVWNIGSSPYGPDIGIRGEALFHRHSLGINIDATDLTPPGISIVDTSVTSPFTTRYAFVLAVTVTL